MLFDEKLKLAELADYYMTKWGLPIGILGISFLLYIGFIPSPLTEARDGVMRVEQGNQAVLLELQRQTRVSVVHCLDQRVALRLSPTACLEAVSRLDKPLESVAGLR